jgi:hypothetical protein
MPGPRSLASVAPRRLVVFLFALACTGVALPPVAAQVPADNRIYLPQPTASGSSTSVTTSGKLPLRVIRYRPIRIKQPHSPEAQREATRWQRTHEQKLKTEERKREQAVAAESRLRQQAEKAEAAKERARQKAATYGTAKEQQKTERLEREKIEKHVKQWDAPLTPEEVARYEKISEARALYVKQQKEAQAEASRLQHSDCVITPVMTDAQLAKCR